jgi:hypothetical protein
MPGFLCICVASLMEGCNHALYIDFLIWFNFVIKRILWYPTYMISKYHTCPFIFWKACESIPSIYLQVMSTVDHAIALEDMNHLEGIPRAAPTPPHGSLVSLSARYSLLIRTWRPAAGGEYVFPCCNPDIPQIRTSLRVIRMHVCVIY